MKIKKELLPFVQISLSAIVLGQSFTAAWLSFFAFFLIIPFLYQLYHTSFRNIWKYSLVFSVSFWGSLVYWIYIYHFSSLPLVLLLLSFYFLLFSWMAKFLIQKFPKFRAFFIPILWVAMEYLISLGFLGFPWGTIGVTQYRFIPFIQIADIFGIWGVSFVVILVNSFLLEIYILYKKKSYKKIISYAGILVILFGAILSYGFIQIHKPVKTNVIKIGLIQANINPNYNWKRIKYNALSRIETLSQLAVDGNKTKLDMIVLWETAIMDYLKFNLKYEKLATNPRFKEIVQFDKKVVLLPQKYKIPFLIGIPDVKRNQGQYKFYNSVVLVDTNGAIVSQYNKMHLVPFGEWFPFKNIFPFIRTVLDKLDAGDYTPGKKYSVFKVKTKSFGVLICYEGIFGALARTFILKGADFFINITDDMWSFSSHAELQHRNLDIFRAVENHVPFIRSGNSGATCLISPTGKIEQQLPLFEPNYLVVSPQFRVNHKNTFYTLYGDWFPKFLLILIILIIVIIIVSIFVKRHNNITKK